MAVEYDAAGNRKASRIFRLAMLGSLHLTFVVTANLNITRGSHACDPVLNDRRARAAHQEIMI